MDIKVIRPKVWVSPNGFRFKTKGEYDAFVAGFEYAKGITDARFEMARENLKLTKTEDAQNDR